MLLREKLENRRFDIGIATGHGIADMGQFGHGHGNFCQICQVTIFEYVGNAEGNFGFSWKPTGPSPRLQKQYKKELGDAYGIKFDRGSGLVRWFEDV